MGIPIEDGEVVFRCNLVAIQDGKMWDYSAGHITTSEGHALIAALEDRLGNDKIHFYPGVSYRHICKVKGAEDSLLATCTPPHDIPEKPIAEFLPHGPGSELLRELMLRSEDILREHPVNMERKSRGDIAATMIWLFWGSSQIPELPPFKELYGLDAIMTSGVDLLRGLAKMAGFDSLDISGVTDGLDNDYVQQGDGALESLDKHDLVVIHIEAPDEAAHAGSIDDKISAIELIDRYVVIKLLSHEKDALRVLIMPDHPTPIAVQTHTPEPVPFMLWGPGFESNGAKRFTEVEAKNTSVFIEEGHTIMSRLTRA